MSKKMSKKNVKKKCKKKYQQKYQKKCPKKKVSVLISSILDILLSILFFFRNRMDFLTWFCIVCDAQGFSWVNSVYHVHGQRLIKSCTKVLCEGEICTVEETILSEDEIVKPDRCLFSQFSFFFFKPRK
jgi:hypothetical protein